MGDLFGKEPAIQAGGAHDEASLARARVLEPLLPGSIFSAEIFGDPPLPALQPAEKEALGSAGSKRLRDFTRGRACARRALLGFGVEATPVLIGEDRAPLWPPGFVGSITHCRDYCAAAVGSEPEFRAIGIDAEPHVALPAGVLELIATPRERRWLQAEAGSLLCWDRILFSAKESAFKAGGRLWKEKLPFDQIEISFDPIAGAFDAGPSSIHGLPRPKGRFKVASGLIATTVVVSASSAV
jgi:4'-phosphopantetheinyl transferase EntD